MAENSNIEWTDHTFNPWIGCTKVSPGCANCYAETLDRNRFSKTLGGASKAALVSHWGKGAPRFRTTESNWRKPVLWNKAVQREINLRAKLSGEENVPFLTVARPRVFCASLADWLDDEVPIEWLADLLKLIHDTPNLDWLLLTKRPERFFARLRLSADANAWGDDEEGVQWLDDWYSDIKAPENVWIGTTVEDQKRADERIPALLQIPAKVRFLSCEPLLEEVDFSKAVPCSCLRKGCNYDSRHQNGCSITGHIHWVICGGESGPGARPMHQDWARSLRDQCQAAAVPFFFKQWGEHLPVGQEPGANGFGEMNAPMYRGTRVGKKAAGRLLDGREWNQFPG